jgi:hypothetical protein
MVQLDDEKWLWSLTLLYDMNHHLHDITTKLQGQQKLISDMSELSK